MIRKVLTRFMAVILLVMLPAIGFGHLAQAEVTTTGKTTIPACENPPKGATLQQLDDLIESCTAEINSGQLTEEDLSYAYLSRGMAHDAKGENDQASADNLIGIDLYFKVQVEHGDTKLAWALCRLTVRNTLLGCNYLINSGNLSQTELAEAYFYRGYYYNNTDNLNLAVSDFTQAIRLNPKFVDAYNDRGLSYETMGEYDLAIADYTSAIRLDPKCAPAYSNRGLALTKKGEYDLAIADYTSALGLDPKFSRAYANRGIAKWAINDDDGAIEDLEAALKLSPDLTYASDKLKTIRQALALHHQRDQMTVEKGKRVALVIGISHYQGNGMDSLPNADGDANAIAKTLTDSGYKVTLITSTDPQGRYKSANNLEQAIDDFAQTQALGAEKVVVWYTGHGHAVAQGQSDPKNLSAKQIDDYILPADYNRGDDPAVKGVNVAKLTNVASASNFVALFIDACRTQTAEGANSTNAGFRAIGTQRKLNGVTIKHDNLYIVYSTQPNAPASDGPAGQHSPFAQAFLDVLTQGGINREMATIFSGIQKRTRELSQQLTGKDQTPIADDQLPVVGSFNLANTEASTGGQKLAAK